MFEWLRRRRVSDECLPSFQEVDIGCETSFEACERQGAGWWFLHKIGPNGINFVNDEMIDWIMNIEVKPLQRLC